MDFTATPEFLEQYEQPDHTVVECVDRAILRLSGDPASAWARQNRVVGDQEAAWLIVLQCGEGLGLYWWQPVPTEPIHLLLLLPR